MTVLRPARFDGGQDALPCRPAYLDPVTRAGAERHPPDIDKWLVARRLSPAGLESAHLLRANDWFKKRFSEVGKVHR